MYIYLFILKHRSVDYLIVLEKRKWRKKNYIHIYRIHRYIYVCNENALSIFSYKREKKKRKLSTHYS